MERTVEYRLTTAGLDADAGFGTEANVTIDLLAALDASVYSQTKLSVCSPSSEVTQQNMSQIL